MGRAPLLLIFVLLLLAPGAARAQGVGIAWTRVPSVIIAGPAGDARAALVHAAVAHWNSGLAAIGSGFRLGPVTRAGGGAPEPGKVVPGLSDGVVISHAGRAPDGQGAVARSRRDRL